MKTQAVPRDGFFIKDGDVYGKCQLQSNRGDGKKILQALQDIIEKSLGMKAEASKISGKLMDWEAILKSIGDGGSTKVLLELVVKFGLPGAGLAASASNPIAIAVTAYTLEQAARYNTM